MKREALRSQKVGAQTVPRARRLAKEVLWLLQYVSSSSQSVCLSHFVHVYTGSFGHLFYLEKKIRSLIDLFVFTLDDGLLEEI